MVFNLIKPKRGPDIFAFNVTRESIVALTGQFADAFVCKKLCHLVYDVVMYGCFWKFVADTICLEKSSVRKGIFFC